MKFYIDGDKDYPTICGTGTEDYFGEMCIRDRLKTLNAQQADWLRFVKGSFF